MSKAISGSTVLIFMIFFHQMVGICVNFLDPSQFFRFLKGRCHDNQFGGKITYPLHLLLWHSGYPYLNVRINSVNYASIPCENFVNFGPVTPEKTGLIFELFVRHGKKTGVFSRISQDIVYWADFL